jgi:hypothetical protein
VTPLDRETFLHIDTLELGVYNWNSKFSSIPLAKAIFRLAINNQLQVVILEQVPLPNSAFGLPKISSPSPPFSNRTEKSRKLRKAMWLASLAF